MSKLIKFNVKNVLLGCHHFCDILATPQSRNISGFAPLVVPRAIPLSRSDHDYYKQTFIRRSTLTHAEALLPRKFGNISLKRVSLEKPVTSKWLDEVQTRPTSTPGCGLSWDSSYSFYYDQKNPKCSVKPNYLPYPPCPPMLKHNPYKEPIISDLFAESAPCTLKTISLNICRFYSANSCQPRRRRRNTKPSKSNPCGPKQTECRPVPKGRPKTEKRKPKFCVPKPKKDSPKTYCPPINADPCEGGKKKSCPQPPKTEYTPKCSPTPRC